jgi:hypothetical protein
MRYLLLNDRQRNPYFVTKLLLTHKIPLHTFPSQREVLVNSTGRLGIRRTARSHCTGDLAIRMFAGVYGDDFITGSPGI